MNREQIVANIGKRVIVNGKGDLAFEFPMQKLIYHSREMDVRINKLTKSGLVMLDVNGKLFNHPVPPKNVDLYKKDDGAICDFRDE